MKPRTRRRCVLCHAWTWERYPAICPKHRATCEVCERPVLVLDQERPRCHSHPPAFLERLEARR